MSPRLRLWAAAAILLAFVLGGLSRISVDVQILSLLPQSLPQVRGLALYLQHLGQPKELIVTLSATDSTTAESASASLAQKLRSSPALVRRAEVRPPWESQPLLLAEFIAFTLLNQPPSSFDEIIARLEPSLADETLASSREELEESLDGAALTLRSYDPFQLTASLPAGNVPSGMDEFSSADGKFRLIYVESARDLGDYRATTEWVTAIKALAQAWQQANPDVALGFTGQPAFVADISSNMQHEMMLTGGVTILLISAIFWACYRHLKPLLVLVSMLLLTFILTLAAAGWVLHDLTVVGVGFASVMIGLSVDYGYFVFNQAGKNPTMSVGELRRSCWSNIVWTCSTTAAVFFALNLSSLPGLAQLGSLVGIGVIVGAAVMLCVFPPLALRLHRTTNPTTFRPLERALNSDSFFRVGAFVTGALVIFLIGVLVVAGPPRLDLAANTLRPKSSGAYAAMDALTQNLSGSESSALSLVVVGRTPQETALRLAEAEKKLAAAKKRGDVESYQTAGFLWPQISNQQTNLAKVTSLAGNSPALRSALQNAGFNDAAFALTDAVLRQWQEWAGQTPPIWPQNDASRWLMRRLVHQSSDGLFVASGFVTPRAGHEAALLDGISSEGIYLVGWSLLGEAMQRIVPREMMVISAVIFVIVVGIVGVGFRSLRSVMLFILNTALVLACLAGAMKLLGGSVGLFGLAAVLLLLGTGTDYSILLLLALRRNGGDAALAQRQLALVIGLCATSAAAGFGSIALANNIALAELGTTCAIGLALAGAISVFLLPAIWRLLPDK